jgi:hypothetical protein
MQRPRTPSNLSESLHHRLNAYALAASAAGVNVLALTPPAAYLLAVGATVAGLFAFSEPTEAKIVYTPARRNVICHATSGGGCHGTVNLNLNNNQRPDFKLYCSSGAGFEIALWARPVDSVNRVWTSPAYSNDAAALRKGAVIKSAKNFLKAGELFMVGSTPDFPSGGPWKHVHNRYLGLKFLIEGKVHYGWARLSTPKQLNKHYPFATLTGYAYETIPNKPIIAGKTHGPDVVTVQDPSLGHLARGASAIPAWRGKD